jgi:hypothetical protein
MVGLYRDWSTLGRPSQSVMPEQKPLRLRSPENQERVNFWKEYLTVKAECQKTLRESGLTVAEQRDIIYRLIAELELEKEGQLNA